MHLFCYNKIDIPFLFGRGVSHLPYESRSAGMLSPRGLLIVVSVVAVVLASVTWALISEAAADRDVIRDAGFKMVSTNTAKVGSCRLRLWVDHQGDDRVVYFGDTAVTPKSMERDARELDIERCFD